MRYHSTELSTVSVDAFPLADGDVKLQRTKESQACEVNDNSDAPLTGYDRIAAYLKTLDGSPGVYRMLDEDSRVLYV